MKAKFKDKERKRIKLMNMTSEEKKSFNLSKKEQMKKQRQNIDYKFQESKRKKEIIQNKSVEEKKMLHQVKKENMKQLRKKSNYKSKESTY